MASLRGLALAIVGGVTGSMAVAALVVGCGGDDTGASPGSSPDATPDVTQSPDVEQGPDEDPALIRNSRQAADAGAAHDTKEHRLRLIVGRVAQGHVCAPQPSRSFLQGEKADIASGFLPRNMSVAGGLDVDRENLAGNAQGTAALGHQSRLAR